jgi:hypothetical protein
MGLAFFLGKECTGGFTDDCGSAISPFNVFWVLFGEESDILTIDIDCVVVDFLDGSLEFSVN